MGDEETMKMLQGGQLFIGIGSNTVQIAETAKVEAIDGPMFTEGERGLYRKPKGFSATYSATISEDAEDAINSIARQLIKSEVVMDVTPNAKHLPRKMKKAFRTGSRYRRDTKWKRKAARWQQRNKLSLLGNITHDDNGDYIFTGMAVD